MYKIKIPAQINKLNHKSFTLLEILLSVVLITVGVVAVVKCISIAVMTSYTVEINTILRNLAQQKMEDLFNTSYSSISSSSDTPRTGYSRTWTVVDNTNYKTVTVVVTKEFKNQNMSFTLLSYITDLSPY